MRSAARRPPRMHSRTTVHTAPRPGSLTVRASMERGTPSMPLVTTRCPLSVLQSHASSRIHIPHMHRISHACSLRSRGRGGRVSRSQGQERGWRRRVEKDGHRRGAPSGVRPVLRPSARLTNARTAIGASCAQGRSANRLSRRRVQAAAAVACNQH